MINSPQFQPSDNFLSSLSHFLNWRSLEAELSMRTVFNMMSVLRHSLYLIRQYFFRVIFLCADFQRNFFVTIAHCIVYILSLRNSYTQAKRIAAFHIKPFSFNMCRMYHASKREKLLMPYLSIHFLLLQISWDYCEMQHILYIIWSISIKDMLLMHLMSFRSINAE